MVLWSNIELAFTYEASLASVFRLNILRCFFAISDIWLFYQWFYFQTHVNVHEKKLFYHLRLVELEIVKTPTYPQHKVGFDHKMSLHTPPHHTNSISVISQLLLTRFWWNFKIGSWEHLEQIPTGMMTFVQATFVLVTFVHIRNISPDFDETLQVGS